MYPKMVVPVTRRNRRAQRKNVRVFAMRDSASRLGESRPPGTRSCAAVGAEPRLKAEGSLSDALIALCSRKMGGNDLERAGLLLGDWLGVAAAGALEPAAIAFRASFDATTSDGPCTALAAGNNPVEAAAFLNGTLGTLLEMDDLHRCSIMHAGDVVVPAAFAAAQHAGTNGRQLLEAIVQGYEVALRIGTAAAKGGYAAWYNSGTCGVFGAAMAASHAMGLNDAEKRDALGQAGMQAGGLWQCRLEPTDSKALATGHAARAGVTSALLAAQGLRGASHILEGELGFFRSFYPDADPDLVLAEPDAGWLVHQVSFKPWPACRHVHAAIGMVLDLRGQLNSHDIERMTVHTYAAGQSFCDNPDPASDHEARFSFQHALAVAFLRGAPRIADFSAKVRADAQVAALRARIDVIEDTVLTKAFPDRMGARLGLVLSDGSCHTVEADHAPGDPEAPMSGSGLATKFQGNLARAGGAGPVADTLIKTIEQLPDADNLTTLNQALADLNTAMANPVGTADTHHEDA
jgi:2-methylcitrate dehydratase PrpD